MRVTTIDHDGFPLSRYGIVGADSQSEEYVVVLFDDLDGSNMVDKSDVELATIENIELRLHGTDLLQDSALRASLAELWRAEATLAGISISAMFPLDSQDVDQFLLAEFTCAGEPWVVRGAIDSSSPTTVVVRADRMNRWDGFI